MKKFPIRLLRSRLSLALVAGIAAVGLVFAVSSFAAGPSKHKQTRKPGPTISLAGNTYTACRPAPRGRSCTKTPDGGVLAFWNTRFTYRTKSLPAGRYRVKVRYHNAGTVPPNYKFDVRIKANSGREQKMALPGSATERTASTVIDLKKGSNKLALRWVNDKERVGSYDTNLAIAGLELVKVAEPRPATKAEKRQQLAKEILQNRRITYWNSSNGSSRAVMQALADGKCAPTTAPNARGKCVKNLDPRMLETIKEVGERRPIQINAITEKYHTNNSNHYKGKALDIQVSSADGTVAAVARKHGGRRNGETSHIHLDWR